MQIVIFTGGLSPKPEDTENYFNSKKIDFVIAADSGLDTLKIFNDFYEEKFQPNFILGDMDSIQDKSLLAKYPSASVEEFPRDKDYTDTELALVKAKDISSDYKNEKISVTLIGGAGGRIDHLLGVYDTFSTKFHADVWLYEKQALYYIKKNDYLKITNLNEKDNVSISRINGKRKGGSLKSNGLEWECKLFRKEGMPSISNRISYKCLSQKVPVELTVKCGIFMLIVPIASSVKITSRQKEK